MKNIILSLFLLFLPFYLLSQEYFYYYKGEKQYLELDTGYVFVSTVDGSALQKSNLVPKETLTLNKEQTSPLLKQKQNIPVDFYWTELKLSGSELKGTYTERINRIKQIEGVQVVSPYFTGKTGKKIGLSNFFYVKLKSLSDTTLLNKYSVDNKVIILKQDKFMPLWFALSCTKETEKNAMEMANKFYESQMFQFAEPDLMVDDLLSCTNDTYFSSQWGLRNTGQYGGTAGMDIKACGAWTLSTGTGVTVAVIDQGVELNHPDLQANIHPLSFDTETGTSPSVVRGDHGVACAGIVGAVGNNSAGIRGVAPNARLMSISNRFQPAPNIRQQVASGINWAVQNGADVISNSWGSDDLISTLIDDAITNAITNGRNGLGCIVVFASGNDNRAVNYPANSNPAILAVGAISPCGQRKSPSSCDGERWYRPSYNDRLGGSNYGDQLDVVAPGVLVPTTDRQGNLGYNPNEPIHTDNGGNKITSDYANRDYTVWFNGTSAACPHVAGVAALMLSVNPTLTGQQVRDVIEQTAQKIGGYSYITTSGRPNGTWNQEMGYGLINAYAAVNAVVPRISGPNFICDQATYTIDLPPGATVQWNTTTNNLLIVDQEDNSITYRKREGNYYTEYDVVIGARITFPEGEELYITINIVLWYSLEEGREYMQVEGGIVYKSGGIISLIYPMDGVLDYEWSCNTKEWFILNASPSRVEFGGGYFLGDLVVNYKFKDPCDNEYHEISQTFFVCENPPECYWERENSYTFFLYPNPATDIVTVELQEEQPADASFSPQRTIKAFSSGAYEIQLWSASAMLRRFTTDQPVYQIPVSGLPAGIYFVREIKEGQIYTKKLIKK